jgi:ribonuclease HI
MRCGEPHQMPSSDNQVLPDPETWHALPVGTGQSACRPTATVGSNMYGTSNSVGPSENLCSTTPMEVDVTTSATPSCQERWHTAEESPTDGDSRGHPYIDLRVGVWDPNVELSKHFSGDAPTEHPIQSVLDLEDNILRSPTTPFTTQLAHLVATEPGEAVLITGLNLVGWLSVLAALGGADDADLYWVVSRGFKVLPTDTTKPSTFQRNYHSVREQEAGFTKSLDDYWQKNVLGAWVHVKGATPNPSLDVPWDVNAMGAVAKKCGAVRIITDCSKPDFLSVNDFIEKKHIKMATVWSAAELVRPGGWMWGVDLEDGYFHITLSPHSWKHLGIKYGKTYLAFLKLCFGLRNAPEVFHRFSGSIVRWAKKLGIPQLVYFLDDFWGYASSMPTAVQQQNIFLALLEALGVKVKASKLVTPTQVILFLGIIIDTIEMVLKLDKDKVKKVYRVIDEFCEAKTPSVSNARSLAGLLNHVTVVIPALKPWMRAVLDLLKGAPRKRQVVMVSESLKEDMRFIKGVLMEKYNARPLTSGIGRVTAGQLETDACSTIGFGWCCLGTGQCRKQRWQGVQWEWHINVMELYAVLDAIRHCRFKNACIPVQVDSTVARGWCKKLGASSMLPTSMLRELALLLLDDNSYMLLSWVDSNSNKRADTLSRDDMTEFTLAWADVGVPWVLV